VPLAIASIQLDGEIMSAWIPFEAIVATSHRVEKYGGVALADAALQQIVDALNDGTLPMIGHHDLTRPIRTKDVEAALVQLDDGERAVRMTGLIDERDWDAVGQVRGMSFTTTERLGRADGLHAEKDPLSLSADAGWFDDETIAEAASIMSEVAPVDGARLLQFSAIDLARVVLDIGYNTVAALGPGIATNAVWDGIKFLLTHRNRREGFDDSPSRIELRTDLATGAVTGIIDTSEPEVAKLALEAYSKAVEAAAKVQTDRNTVIVWRPDDDDGAWVPLEIPED
jgi:hypothetical protein